MLTIAKDIKPDAYAYCGLAAYIFRIFTINSLMFSSIFMSVMKLKQCIKVKHEYLIQNKTMSNVYVHRRQKLRANQNDKQEGCERVKASMQLNKYVFLMKQCVERSISCSNSIIMCY